MLKSLAFGLVSLAAAPLALAQVQLGFTPPPSLRRRRPADGGCGRSGDRHSPGAQPDPQVEVSGGRGGGLTGCRASMDRTAQRGRACCPP